MSSITFPSISSNGMVIRMSKRWTGSEIRKKKYLTRAKMNCSIPLCSKIFYSPFRPESFALSISSMIKGRGYFSAFQIKKKEQNHEQKRRINRRKTGTASGVFQVCQCLWKPLSDGFTHWKNVDTQPKRACLEMGSRRKRGGSNGSPIKISDFPSIYPNRITGSRTKRATSALGHAY